MQRPDVLQAAFEAVAAKDGAAGVDGQTLDSITATAESKQAWLDALQAELRQKRYRANAVRRVWIPKGSGSGGEKRPLGIPTVKDRVVQMALYLVLMPIFEADFHEQSYGFRPRRRAQQALDAISEAVKACRVEVLDADIAKYFDEIPHGPLLREVARRVSDGTVLALIKSWLRAPVVEEDRAGQVKVSANRQGTPQGGVIPPLLANIFLNLLDHEINEGSQKQATLVRYADDFVVLCRHGQGEQIRERIKAWLEARGLRARPESGFFPTLSPRRIPAFWTRSEAQRAEDAAGPPL